MYTPDNYSQWERYERQCMAWLASRPVCHHCGEPIQDEPVTDPDTGADICPDCWVEYEEDEDE